MIQSFADAASADLFHGTDSKAARTFNTAVRPVIRRTLDLVNAATTLEDLRSPPGNRLEALKGHQRGRHSIRINDRYSSRFGSKRGTRTTFAARTTTERRQAGGKGRSQ